MAGTAAEHVLDTQEVPRFSGRFAHLTEAPPHPPDVPDELAAALLTALAKEAADRPPTATALARMLHVARTPSHTRPTGG